MNRQEKLQAMQNREYSVVKSNQILQKTTTELTLNEQKCILYCISKIKEGDEADKQYSMSIPNFCDLMGIEKNGRIYEKIRKQLDKLSNKTTWFFDKEDKRNKSIRWITALEHDRSTIYFRFDYSVHKHLFNLKQYFASYELWNIMLLKSKYSLTVYELLKSYSNLKEIEIDLEDFKAKCDVKYSRYTDLRRYVIDVAVEEINKKTDIKVSYTTVKNGRSVTGLVFKINTLNSSDKNKRHHEVENAIKIGTKNPVKTNLSL